VRRLHGEASESGSGFAGRGATMTLSSRLASVTAARVVTAVMVLGMVVLAVRWSKAIYVVFRLMIDPVAWQNAAKAFVDFDWVGHGGYAFGVVLLVALAAYYWVRVSRRLRPIGGVSQRRKVVSVAVTVVALFCVWGAVLTLGNLAGLGWSFLNGFAMRALYYHGPVPPLTNAEHRELDEAFATGFWAGAGGTLASFALLSILVATLRLVLASKRLATEKALLASTESEGA